MVLKHVYFRGTPAACYATRARLEAEGYKVFRFWCLSNGWMSYDMTTILLPVDPGERWQA